MPRGRGRPRCARFGRSLRALPAFKARPKRLLLPEPASTGVGSYVAAPRYRVCDSEAHRYAQAKAVAGCWHLTRSGPDCCCRLVEAPVRLGGDPFAPQLGEEADAHLATIAAVFVSIWSLPRERPRRGGAVPGDPNPLRGTSCYQRDSRRARAKGSRNGPEDKRRAVARRELVQVVCCDYREALEACFDLAAVLVAFEAAAAAPCSVARSPVVPMSSTVSACAFCITPKKASAVRRESSNWAWK